MTRRLPPWAVMLGGRLRALPRWTYAAAAASVLLVLAAAIWLGPREQLVLAGAFGRFHPALVHLPIGALIVAAVLVALARSGRNETARAALVPILVLAASSAVLAVIAGQALATDGTYSGGTFDTHRLLGYLVACVTTAAAATAWYSAHVTSRQLRLASDVCVGLGMLALGITGHLGGTLTHGEGYLTERLPAPLNAWFGRVAAPIEHKRVQPSEVMVYDALVAPILTEHCVDCHGPSKANGELRLDTPEYITAGGRTGAALVAGQAAASDLVRRLWLPPSHADVMPPKSKPTMPVVDASVLRWWIDQGASFKQSLADVELVPEVAPAIQARVGELTLDGPTLLAFDPGPLDTAALEALTAQALPVSRLAEGVDWLQVEARGLATRFGDAQLQALTPIAPQVTWMDLGGTAVTDEGLRLLASFPNLTRLHLDRTPVTDSGLESLAALEHLEMLNVYGTAVTDAGLARVGALASLRALYVADTGITNEGVRAAMTAHPELVVHGAVTTTDVPPAPPAAGRAKGPTPAR